MLPLIMPTIYCLGCGYDIRTRYCLKCKRESASEIWDRIDDYVRRQTSMKFDPRKERTVAA